MCQMWHNREGSGELNGIRTKSCRKCDCEDGIFHNDAITQFVLNGSDVTRCQHQLEIGMPVTLFFPLKCTYAAAK